MKEKVKIEDMIKTPTGWIFEVSIGETNYEILLEKEYWKKLTGEEIDPSELIKKSFRFLLLREPKESILKSFNLKIIGKYFPEYEKEIVK